MTTQSLPVTQFGHLPFARNILRKEENKKKLRMKQERRIDNDHDSIFGIFLENTLHKQVDLIGK